MDFFFLETIIYNTQKSKLILENLIFIPEHYTYAYVSLCKGDSIINLSGEAVANQSDLSYNAFWEVGTLYVFFL